MHREQFSCDLCPWRSGPTPQRRWHLAWRVDMLILNLRWELHTRTHNRGGWFRE